MTSFNAATSVSEFLARLQATEQEFVSQGIDPSRAERLAEVVVRRSFEQEDIQTNKASPDLTQFSKFEQQISPDSYLQTLDGEFTLKGITQDSDKMKYLPLLIRGKAAYFVDTLRGATSWNQMCKLLVQEFTVDSNVIIGELRALRCIDYNVDAFTEKFLEVANKLNKGNAGLEAQLKMLYVDNLPFKIKEKLWDDRQYQGYTLSQVMSEAKRYNNTNNVLYKSKGNYNNKSSEPGGKWQEQGNKQQQQQQNQKKQVGWTDRRNAANLVTEIWGEDKVNIVRNELMNTVQQAVDQGVKQDSSSEMQDSDWAKAATYLEYLTIKDNLSDMERHVVLQATHALKDQMVRTDFADIGTGTNRKMSPKELLTEAERVLLRAASGMSLLERLRRDEQLREDIRELLEDLAKEANRPQLKPKGKRTRSQSNQQTEAGDTSMRDVSVRGMHTTDKVFTQQQIVGFKEYYGAHPDLVEGAKWFRNSERQEFLKGVAKTEDDITAFQPVTANIPQVNILVANKYKVRAMVDSGSTVTLMSSGLFKRLTALKDQLKPTSLGFYGVGKERLQYDGILYEVPLQLTDYIKCKLSVAVYPNDEHVMLLGNDLLGGPNAKVQIVSMNATHSSYLLSDQEGNIGVMQYLKNIEGAAFPAAPQANKTVKVNGADEIDAIFR